MKDITEMMHKAKPSQTVGAKSSDDKFYQAWLEDVADRKRKQAERIRKDSNLGTRFQRRTFQTFERERDPTAYDTCTDYVKTYTKSERNSLLLIGGVGTGKTHLMASIANQLLDNGIPVLFDTFDGHLHKLKAEFNGDGKGYLRKMQSIDMLMMDDVGKEKQTDWSRSIMFDIVNYRYEHILPIVITTNLTTKQLADYFGDAVWSRLCEMCRGAQMSGTDYRRLQ
jgi:DNA replication protein DnaC